MSKHLELHQWLDEVCKLFAELPWNKGLTNKTPYNIDSLRDEFEALYMELFDREPPAILFDSEIKARCKQKENSLEYYSDDE